MGALHHDDTPDEDDERIMVDTSDLDGLTVSGSGGTHHEEGTYHIVILEW